MVIKENPMEDEKSTPYLRALAKARKEMFEYSNQNHKMIDGLYRMQQELAAHAEKKDAMGVAPSTLVNQALEASEELNERFNTALNRMQIVYEHHSGVTDLQRTHYRDRTPNRPYGSQHRRSPRCACPPKSRR
jgi:hypothetical protein